MQPLLASFTSQINYSQGHNTFAGSHNFLSYKAFLKKRFKNQQALTFMLWLYKWSRLYLSK